MRKIKKIALIITVNAMKMLLFNASSVIFAQTFISKIICKNNEKHAYSIYIPSNNSDREKLPVVFMFDPGGIGDRPVKMYREIAEELGFILVGSWNFRNGLSYRELLNSHESISNEVTSKYNTDSNRCWAGGFSGGARACLNLNTVKPGTFSAVILIGAFYSDPDVTTDFPANNFVLINGIGDFNRREMNGAEKKLDRLKKKYWHETFVGNHEWAPVSSMRRGVTYLKWQNCVEKKLPEKDVLESKLIQLVEDDVKNNISSGFPILSVDQLGQLVRLFGGNKGLSSWNNQLNSIKSKNETIDQLNTSKKYDEYAEIISKKRYTKEFVSDFIKFREISTSKSGLEKYLATELIQYEYNLLNVTALSVHSSGDWNQSVKMHLILSRLNPSASDPCYNAACAFARMGQKREALEQLAQAVERGFSNVELMNKDEDLKNLRNEPGFKDIIIKIGKR